MKGSGRAGTVRPSMVIMTGKLLGVTEGIAAMNLRIACGVGLCLVFICATFVVNIVAFDYAKDQETVEGLLTAKGSDVVVSTVSKPAFRTPEMGVHLDPFNWLALNGVKIFATAGNDPQYVKYTFNSQEIVKCPVEDSPYCHSDGMLYLGYTTNGRTIYGIQEEVDNEFQIDYDLLLDTEFISKIVVAPFKKIKEDNARHLLCMGCSCTGSGYSNTGCDGNSMFNYCVSGHCCF